MPRPRPTIPMKRMRAKALDVLARIVADPAADPVAQIEAAAAILNEDVRAADEARMRRITDALARLLALAEAHAARTGAIDDQEREAEASADALEAAREVAMVEALGRAAARRVYRLPERIKGPPVLFRKAHEYQESL
jgi:hypothetical protein